jgi:hypothetical protein
MKLLLGGFLSLIPAMLFAQADWKPMDNPLMTQWGTDLDPQHVLSEYPRPQMARRDWFCLNGVWELSLSSKRATDFKYDQKILVPFPVESALSGVKAKVDADTAIRYRRQFTIPAEWAGKKLLLHFGAVDWSCEVKVNGKVVGNHKGGFDPLTFNISDAIQKVGPQTLEVQVEDPTDTSTQPRGKQTLHPKGIYYTPTSGIWQTVWLEPVPEIHIQWLTITPDIDKGEVRIKADVSAGDGLRIEATASDEDQQVADSVNDVGHDMVLRIPHPKLWTPHSAFLYRLSIKLLPRDSNQPIDEVSSYFGMRKISLGKDHGITKIFLNNQPCFMFGVLDQGFWPDGLFTAPSDSALRSDLVTLKELGFNMVRKHVKVEPDRWYYWCDKMGMLVWQDMPSGDADITPEQPDIERTPESTADFETELAAMVHTHYNHPCIVTWVLFNEGWGQFDTANQAKKLKELDPSRLVDATSGWADRGVGDFVDKHDYPGPGADKPTDRAAVLGEFGGLGLPIPGHMWSKDGWSYQGFKSQDELTNGFIDLIEKLKPMLASPGLSAAVYTQTTDVETELNGLLTYDRSLLKLDEKAAREAVESLYAPPSHVETLLPTAKEQPSPWRYTSYQPDDSWPQSGYDDSAWATGASGFGTAGTVGAVVKTTWDQDQIWLRRSFSIPRGKHIQGPSLLVRHVEDADIYMDGTLVASLPGGNMAYELVPIKDASKLLSPGKHVLAVYCRRGPAGQYIDCGIVDTKPG